MDTILTAIFCTVVSFFVGVILARVFPDALPAAFSGDWSKQAAEWLTGIGTLVLAAVAVFQDTIRGWFYGPKLRIAMKPEPPDCIGVPVRVPVRQGRINTLGLETNVNGIYLRLWVKNHGNIIATNVEVYAQSLRRKRTDEGWETIKEFPPMNLTWSDIGGMYFPRIAPGMGKHCDIASVLDPATHAEATGGSLKQGLSTDQTALTFLLISRPFHNGHVVGPGEYELDILVAAENARPVRHSLVISLAGKWYADAERMLRDGVCASMVR